jgi:peptidoglycan/LPS O-acetylase OafA/YrhL
VWTLGVRHLLWVDLALGPAVACLLVGLATGQPGALVRLLDSRPARSLGQCSYSLYLLHEPIVIVAYQRFVFPRYHHGSVAFLVAVGLAVPVAIVLALVFARAFERPFLRQRAAAGLQSASFG